jgi:glyoxylase-like metal-dependent hydrolase (beta-lactamase superfamily II)
MSTSHSPSRRTFLKTTSACAAHLTLMATPFPAAARALWSGRTQESIVAREPFGRLEEVGGGLFTFVSTPLGGDYTTVCNGGIIAGRSGVLVIEAFQTPEGALWIAERARELTERWPTHVLITHYHSDHSGGVDGFFKDPPSGPGVQETSAGGQGPRILATETTRDLAVDHLPDDAPESLPQLWADVVLLSPQVPTTLDLGGREVHLVPREGHTASDVTAELPEENILWCGDLFWNGMFPNYMDAVPSRLSKAVRALQGFGNVLYVPGHGPLATSRDMARYVAVIDGIEETARNAAREGWTAEEAADRHRIPEDLGDWTLFNPAYFQRAIEAWMREWESGSQGMGGDD